MLAVLLNPIHKPPLLVKSWPSYLAQIGQSIHHDHVFRDRVENVTNTRAQDRDLHGSHSHIWSPSTISML
jgi:hypothetical protein